MATVKMSTAGNDILIKDSGRPDAIVEAQTNGDDIYPGHVVTCAGERSGPSLTVPDIDLCANNEAPFGVVLCNPDHDIDTAYADNTIVKVARCGGGCKVRVWAGVNCANTEVGEWVVALNATNGKVRKNDGDTDADFTRVGRCAKTFTLNAANHTIMEIWLD